jgi:4-amino-4-deoxy-L-arabinose transferase-like glycosyltransferase
VAVNANLSSRVISVWYARLWRAVSLAAAATLVLGLATRMDPLPQGLRAEYFPNPTWTPPAAIVGFDRRPASVRFFDAWSSAPPDAFSATWTGSLVAPAAGTYELATESDDGSWVYVDGRLVVDNGGVHPRRRVTGSIELARGPHALLILYFQNHGELYFDFLWGRDGAALTPVPAWALWGRKVGSLARVIPSLALRALFEVVGFVALVLAILACLVTACFKLTTALQRAGIWTEMRWILAGSFVLSIAGIWWGLPSSWVAIETVPVFVLSAFAHHFANGWFDAYPPLQYYLLSLAGSPILVLHRMDILSYYTPLGFMLLILSYRLLSVCFAVGTIAAVAFIGLRAFGRRAALFAAGTAALVAPFIYYAKTANVDVPYVFWYTLSLFFYLRLLQESRLRDYVWFGITATLAFCTKDQAYALYLTAPLVIVAELWRQKRRDGVPRPLARALTDRRLVAAAAAAVTTFVLVANLIFNFNGYADHIRSITDAAAQYRVFEPTLSGRWQLLVLTGQLAKSSMGWPLFIASVAGVLSGLLTRPLRRTTIWLTAPIPAYYLGLINVVLYNYDRFMLPVCVVLALFAGLALDQFLSSGAASPRWRRTAVAAAFVYTFLYAATVDVLMIADSRYAVGRWMATHVDRTAIVGAAGLHEYLPRLEDYRVSDIATVEELRTEHPRYFVLNADYARAADPGSEFARLARAVQSGRLGYRLTLRYRTRTPLSWLPGAHPDLVGDRQETAVFSILRNINPTIEWFEQEKPAPPSGESGGY